MGQTRMLRYLKSTKRWHKRVEEVKSRRCMEIWNWLDNYIERPYLVEWFHIFMKYTSYGSELRIIIDEYRMKFYPRSENRYMKNLHAAYRGGCCMYYELFIEAPCIKADFTKEYSPFRVVFLDSIAEHGVITSCDYVVQKGVDQKRSWWLKFVYNNFGTDILPILNSQHELCVRYGNQQRVDWYVPLPEDVRYLIKQFL